MQILRHKIAVTMAIYTEVPSAATREALGKLAQWSLSGQRGGRHHMQRVFDVQCYGDSRQFRHATAPLTRLFGRRQSPHSRL